MTTNLKSPSPQPAGKVSPSTQSSSTAAPKRRRIWGKLIIVILLVGGGYYLYQQWSFLSSLWPNTNQTEQMAQMLDAVDQRVTTLEQTANNTARDLAEAKNTLTELRHELLLRKQNETRLQTRLDSLDAAQNSNLPAETQLQLIDLHLRQSGDTEAAANALLSLQDMDGIDHYWLTGEIARLQDTPSKSQIIEIINILRQLTKPSAQVTITTPVVINNNQGGLWGSVKSLLISLYKVQKVDDVSTQTTPATMTTQEILTRLEILLAANQNAAYLVALDDLAAAQTDAFGSPVRNVAVHIKALQTYGAPQYFLNR